MPALRYATSLLEIPSRAPNREHQDMSLQVALNLKPSLKPSIPPSVGALARSRLQEKARGKSGPLFHFDVHEDLDVIPKCWTHQTNTHVSVCGAGS